MCVECCPRVNHVYGVAGVAHVCRLFHPPPPPLDKSRVGSYDFIFLLLLFILSVQDLLIFLPLHHCMTFFYQLRYMKRIIGFSLQSSTLMRKLFIAQPLTPQNLSIEICIKKIVSICIYVKIALTKKKKKKNLKI